MAARATAYLRAETELLLTDLVVAETVYVLESFYEAPRTQVAEADDRPRGHDGARGARQGVGTARGHTGPADHRRHPVQWLRRLAGPGATGDPYGRCLAGPARLCLGGSASLLTRRVRSGVAALCL